MSGGIIPFWASYIPTLDGIKVCIVKRLLDDKIQRFHKDNKNY